MQILQKRTLQFHHESLPVNSNWLFHIQKRRCGMIANDTTIIWSSHEKDISTTLEVTVRPLKMRKSHTVNSPIKGPNIKV